MSAPLYEQSLTGNHDHPVAPPFQYHDYNESLLESLIEDYERIKSELSQQIRESGNVKDTGADDRSLKKQTNGLSIYCLQNYLEHQDQGHEPDISAIVMAELKLEKEESQEEIKEALFFH